MRDVRSAYRGVPLVLSRNSVRREPLSMTLADILRYPVLHVRSHRQRRNQALTDGMD